MFKTIMWATDGSDNADRALPFAKELAEVKGAKLVIAHCNERLTGRATGYPVNADEDELVEKIERQAAELRAVGIDVRVQVVTGTGAAAAHVIADIARDVGADVVIVGTRGQSAFVGLLVGSVTQRLLHLVHCPVLAVPPFEHARQHEPELVTTSATS